MKPPHRPILYSFRRCPFAIRARLALLLGGIEVELREVSLKAEAAGTAAGFRQGHGAGAGGAPAGWGRDGRGRSIQPEAG